MMMKLQAEAKGSELGVRGSVFETANSQLPTPFDFAPFDGAHGLRQGLRPNGQRRSRSSVHSARGAAQIEFILTIITIFFLMFWIWELILMTYTMNTLADAAKEGVRVAIVQGSSAGTCDPSSVVTTRVQTFAAMSLQNTAGMTVTVNSPDASGCKSPNRVRVTVAYPYIPFFNLGANYTLHSSAEGRIVFNPT